MNIILATQSKYKKELFSSLNLEFTAVSADIDEGIIQEDPELSPPEKALKLSYMKAKKIADQQTSALVIGADQILFYNGKILEKPGSIQKAEQQLLQLSGQEHYLYTAYTILYLDKTIQHCDTTALQMRKLSIDEVSRYQQFDKAFDTVGAYKLESLGISLFDEIETKDFNSIVGLPLIALAKDLRSFDLQVP